MAALGAALTTALTDGPAGRPEMILNPARPARGSGAETGRPFGDSGRY
jgi:hypothetical protein